METTGSDNLIVLVTPVWNDTARLEIFGAQLAEALKEAGMPIRWVIADDGSSQSEVDALRRLIENFREKYTQVEGLFLEERSYKGGAIYQAWDLYSEASWLAFVDADGAIDANTILEMIRSASRAHVCVVGVRQNSVDTPVVRLRKRVLSCLVFNFCVRMLTPIRISDTQCGAKVISGPSYRAVSADLKERGYVFDVELLTVLQVQGITVEQMAIPWTEKEGGKVSLFSDAWRMFAGLLRIRQRLKAKQPASSMDNR